MKKIETIVSTLILGSFLLFSSCGGGSTTSPDFDIPDDAEEETEEIVIKVEDIEDPLSYKGIGPISSIELADEIDEDLAEYGLEVFNLNCVACHKLDIRLVGPALAGVTERRSSEWIMNMILNPDLMVKEDTIAKALLAEYGSPMNNQNLSEKEARGILEYLRANL
tara:strand:+ start:383 stop:880 length:498 start_codon:yes stop_codon:yes gene_type:complete